PAAPTTANEDGSVGSRYLAVGVVHLLARWSLAADPLALDERADLVTQDLHLTREIPVLDNAFHRVADLVELERLGDVVERAELHGADGVIGRTERGHDQDARLW